MASEPTPPPLSERAAAGDTEALQQLLVQCLPQLEAYLRVQVGPALRAKESISDLVQSVCGEVLQDLAHFDFRGEAQFRHWLCKHALHKVINKREFYGAAKRDLRREVSPAMRAAADTVGQPESVLTCYATLCTPSRHAAGREEVERFERALDQLPEDYREAILLRRVIGLDYPEIAAAMERSEGATRNLVHRGLARLSALLTP
ncbi:MAG: sigma-70 family RNA polymerase sigma factor [Planctomycetota bacterium]